MPSVPKVLLLIESSRASGRALLRGVAAYANHHGPWAFYWEPGGLEKVWPHLATFDADGIILRDVEKVDEVLNQGIPAVVFGHSHAEVPGLVNVLTDDQSVGVMAAEHLLNCGFRHFAYCGFKDKPWAGDRAASFQRRIGKAGWATDFYWSDSSSAERSWRKELNSLADWLRRLPQPLGLMACNDDRGRHVVEACKLAQLSVPDKVAIIGADNDRLVCELSAPPLSSVAIDFERAGYEAAEQLDIAMRTGQPKQTRILSQSPAVVARQSTHIVAPDDPALARCLRFILDHSRQSIRVDDVVSGSGLSRRVLEKRFRAALGRSIMREIRRVRVEQICRMLLETNHPISQLAMALGYDGIEHVARYFAAEKGMSPQAYRRRYGHRRLTLDSQIGD